METTLRIFFCPYVLQFGECAFQADTSSTWGLADILGKKILLFARLKDTPIAPFCTVLQCPGGNAIVQIFSVLLYTPYVPT